jgi:hypothetical protein
MEKGREGDGEKKFMGKGMKWRRVKGERVSMSGCLSIKFSMLGIEDVTSRRSRAYRLSQSTDLGHCNHAEGCKPWKRG